MDKQCLFFCLLVLAMTGGAPVAYGADEWESNMLCGPCTKCDATRCPPSVYSVPDIKGGESKEHNAYYGWNISSASVSGYHRFSNYMDKCSRGQSYLTADKNDKVNLRSLSSWQSLSAAEWKSINPPQELNHHGFRFWLSHSSGKCLTVF